MTEVQEFGTVTFIVLHSSLFFSLCYLFFLYICHTKGTAAIATNHRYSV